MATEALKNVQKDAIGVNGGTSERQLDRDVSLERNLTDIGKLLGWHGNNEVVHINEFESLIRIHDESGTSLLTLLSTPVGKKDSSRIVRCRGNLFKSSGDYVRFNSLLLLKVSQQVEIGPETLLEVDGFWVDAANQTVQFHDRSPNYEELDLGECLGCKKGKNFINKVRSLLGLPIKKTFTRVELVPDVQSYSSRKVGKDRCWLCTSVAIFSGIIISISISAVSPGIFTWIGVDKPEVLQRFQLITLGIVMLYTIWRVAFWGFLPLQDVVAKKLLMKHSIKNLQKNI